MLKSRLPPLEPLIAFEAAARLLSFTRAGEELHLTQAAISQQIRSLEESLQVKLFTRSHRAVQLTNEGREYQHTVAAVLKQLAGATTDIQNTKIIRKLTIGCDQSFATQWISPKLDALREILPDTAIRMVASDDDDECLASDVQLTILHGDGNWPGLNSRLLFEEEVFPVCSPDYRQPLAQADWAEWLLESDLIDLSDSHWNWMNWRLWLGGNEVERPLGNRLLQINSYPLVIEAACNSHGVALGWRYLIDDLIQQGRLIKPFDRSLKTEYGYYLIWHDSALKDESVRAFSDWLCLQFGCDPIHP
ncbi:MAG: LysR substrate-binding domain-containing protein [Pseudomonadota bacterium]